MQYTIRAFIEGRDGRVDEICRTFCSMQRTAYNMLRDGADASTIKQVLRERYGIRNARWIQSAINQARAMIASQEEGIKYRIELCKEKVKNTGEKMKNLSSPLKIEGCRAKIEKYELKIRGLRKKSYPGAMFGSRKLFHQMSVAEGQRRDELRKEWRERRSNHFFSVGQANQHGNGNTRLLLSEEGGGAGFFLEIRNWPNEDFSLPLRVPEHWSGLLGGVMRKAESVKLGVRGELLEGGLPYSIRVTRSSKGYQVLVSFELKEPIVEWSGRIAGIDINPEGIACTVVSRDGNLIATRFFRDSRLISASSNKRKWLLKNLVNRMLRWGLFTHGCNAVATEKLKFKGAYDYGSRTNFKLSNFMKRKMLQTIKLHALKMNMLLVEIDPAYSSQVAVVKYSKQFGGFNRHQLAAFVIARRATGYGEVPVLECLPKTKRERVMWNHCARYYGYQPRIQTLLHHEPMEWKSGGDGSRGEAITELLTAPPANTSARGLSHNPAYAGVHIAETSIRRAGRVHPNRHTNGGDGATGYRVGPAPIDKMGVSASCDTRDTVGREFWTWLLRLEY